MKLHYLIYIFFLACAATAIGQQFEEEIFLKSGEIYKGKILAISNDRILVTSTPNVVSIKREDVLYILHADHNGMIKSRPIVSSDSEPRIKIRPMNKAWYNEMEMGFAPASPFFAISNYKLWHSYGKRLLLGAGLGCEVWRYSMFNLALNERFYLNKPKMVRPFFDASLAFSFNEHMWQSQTWFIGTVDYKFSTIKQFSLGPGLLFDTGLDVGFILKTAWQLTYFSLDQVFSPTYRVEGKYLISTAALSASVIF